MKNFINVRLMGSNNLHIRDRIKHNLRRVKTRNISNDSKNTLINFNNKKMGVFDSKERYKFYSKLYKTDRKEHNEKYKQKNKRNLRQNFSTWSEGVITFSEQIHHDLGVKYTKEELIETSRTFLKDFEKEFETKIKMFVLHTDEKTPHFHFFFENFDKNGASITYKNRTREKLSFLQDLRFKHFQNLGMKRGIKKEKSKIGIRDYKTIKQYKTEEILQLNEVQDNIKEEIENLKIYRKKIIEDKELIIEEKKLIYKEISKKQNTLRNLKRLITKFNRLKKHINKEKRKELLKEIIEEIKKTDFSPQM